MHVIFLYLHVHQDTPIYMLVNAQALYMYNAQLQLIDTLHSLSTSDDQLNMRVFSDICFV